MPNIQYSKVLQCKYTIAQKGASPYSVGNMPYCTFWIRGRKNPITCKGISAELQYKEYMKYKQHKGGN